MRVTRRYRSSARGAVSPLNSAMRALACRSSRCRHGRADAASWCARVGRCGRAAEGQQAHAHQQERKPAVNKLIGRHRDIADGVGGVQGTGENRGTPPHGVVKPGSGGRACGCHGQCRCFDGHQDGHRLTPRDGHRDGGEYSLLPPVW